MSRTVPRSHDFAAIHDHHVVAQLGDDTQVVRDEQDRTAHASLELAQAMNDLHLERRVRAVVGMFSLEARTVRYTRGLR